MKSWNQIILVENWIERVKSQNHNIPFHHRFHIDEMDISSHLLLRLWDTYNFVLFVSLFRLYLFRFSILFFFFVDFVNWIRIFVELLNTDILNGSNACKFGCLSREMFLTSTLYDFGIHDLSSERIWRENFLSKIKRERHFWRLIKIEWQRKSNS